MRLERAVLEIFAEAATSILKNPLPRVNGIFPGQLHRRKLDSCGKPHTSEALALDSEHLAETASEVRSLACPPTDQKELRENRLSFVGPDNCTRPNALMTQRRLAASAFFCQILRASRWQ